MLVVNETDAMDAIQIEALVDELRSVFAGAVQLPPRQIVRNPGTDHRLLLVMPAFEESGAGVVKLATVYSDNPTRGIERIHAAIVAFSEDGVPFAILDGGVITKLRTGAASALASTYLSRTDATNLVVIGTGAIAPFMAYAHASVRPIKKITVLGRNQARCDATVRSIQRLLAKSSREEPAVRVGASFEDSISKADIITCATSASSPILAGRLVRPGTFVDLVGSFSPDHREADDEAMLLGRIFVDTMEGALTEAGDIVEPISRGVLKRTSIAGELADLVTGRVAGRREAAEITLFKSVGTALEDLAAARLALRHLGKR